MRLNIGFLGKRKLTTSIAAGAVALALGVGGFAIADSGSSASAASGSPATTAAMGKVIPFTQGQPSPATKVGQVPSSFTAGAGTIVTGASADKAKAAVLAVYPGVDVNRVVLLSDGSYNVHIIGVNWPHHVFVDKNFKVVGAE
ncbi:MAG: hypothetical protein JWL73_1584 [Actinomycetia bacterium]|nr:hypothetical protein [Actinomycetes bacterium]